jgi:hypothetical protein
MKSFYETITAAVADIVEHGYDSSDRVAFWMEQLREAARRDMISEARMAELLQGTLSGIYRRLVENGLILKRHPGVGRFTLERVKPQLRLELDRRVLASANLIKLNRAASIEKTLQRFSGWATSVPKGGTEAAQRQKVKDQIRKPLASLPFEERRVLTDQGHKFVAALSETLAVGGNAIAAIWHSHWRQPGYDFRPDHKERDGQVYLIRDSWAQQRGLVKPGPAGYVDQSTHPGEEVFCRCNHTYVYNLSSLPEDMLTAKGKAELKNIRVA